MRCWDVLEPLPRLSSLALPPQRPLSPVLSLLGDLAAAQSLLGRCFKHIQIQMLPSFLFTQKGREGHRQAHPL